MLFIHASLAMGGIETFYIRLAKERQRSGHKTKIFLLSPRSRSDQGLLADAKKYADVYFLDEIALLPSWVVRLVPYHLSLLIPLNRRKILEVTDGVDYMHTSGGFGAYFGAKLLGLVSQEIPITIGLYHSLEFCWGAGPLPYYERKNREMFFKILPKRNIVFFNENMIDFYGNDFSEVNLFPLGVVESRKISTFRKEAKRDRLLIGSVGRLVEFKSYNLWMIDVVRRLREEGVDACYHIYGNGPLKEEMQSRIAELGMSEHVKLKGTVNYSDFEAVVDEFDVFIGSGTAIVEAASIGVPSIIGIENERSPSTYGFFSEIPGFSYNEDGLYTKRPVLGVLKEFLKLDLNERAALAREHIEKANLFSISSCNKNFSLINPLKAPLSKERYSMIFRLKYSLSFFSFSAFLRLKGVGLNRVVRG
jgi:glycosyltransferase involved in cell wall biosynthesis